MTAFFSFPTLIYLLAVGAGLFTTALSLPAWRRWCVRAGVVDDPGHRKIHLEPIPLAGGLAVLTGLVVPIAAGLVALRVGLFDAGTVSVLAHGFDRRQLQLIAVVGGALGMVLLGWLDDRYELRPSLKFAGQVLIAFVVAMAGVRITLFVPSIVFSVAVTVLWIVTLTNALNFMDNMNGLCAGLGLIGAFCFGMKSALAGQYLVALLGFLSVGALMGFLPYNFPRATVFLGDAGSHLVGYLLGVLAILPHFYTKENPSALAVLNPLLILAVPLFDLVSVVLIRWKAGRPFYVGDTNHLSHRLVRKGLSQTTAVLVIWLLAAMCGAMAFL
ncbi:MAG: undecaprenyl/decaprenyl-phosphate alpha-N-acetylglucosaminyl 1-phosphate transferase [Verrucomicrobia bacterium]|nr:undecaprenyl/decaprenyl-phosphate alpha-N-acetylglucosaminyl 1-phosphate transferase [Verrucomicrobiota bacterium]